MKSAITAILISAPHLLSSQEAATQKFEIADVHVSPNQVSNRLRRASGTHGSRYEVDGYSLVDLIRAAYGFAPDKVVGGPSWVEMTRYDVLAKIPPDSNADGVKQMLQALLAERFGLKVHEDTRPVPVWALTAGKKPSLKEGDGTGDTGCKAQGSANANVPPPPPPPGGGSAGAVNVISTVTINTNGNATTLHIGPDGQVSYSCRNVSMPAFAQTLRTFVGANLGGNPITDETGLKGVWNFDVHYTFSLLALSGADQGDRLTLPAALEKQLGLKLEQHEAPAKVLVIDGANEKPSPNPPGIADALAAIALPTSFEVASVKLAEAQAGPAAIRMQMSPGGRYTIDRAPLNLIVLRAFNILNNREALQGGPDFGPDRFDISAKVTLPPGVDGNDPELQATLLRNLLVDRFGMKYHTEDRQVTAYALAAGKPKMKKSDPSSRARCTQGNAMTGAAPGTRSMICQNVTMAQFALQLQGANQDVVWPVEDQTKLEGGYDFTLTYAAFTLPAGMGRAPGDAQASDPSGSYTLLEAVEKQLGLKLEKVKRTEKVIVIDHLDTKPTEN